MKTLTDLKIKYVLLLCISLFSTVVKSQLVSRATNNNNRYNDSSAKIEIDRIYALLNLGENFDSLALRYSQDPGSYLNFGELKPTTMAEYVPEYRNTVLKLSLNEVSKPFKTEYGYHIVKLISKKDDFYVTKHILIRTD